MASTKQYPVQVAARYLLAAARRTLCNSTTQRRLHWRAFVLVLTEHTGKNGVARLVFCSRV